MIAPPPPLVESYVVALRAFVAAEKFNEADWERNSGRFANFLGQSGGGRSGGAGAAEEKAKQFLTDDEGFGFHDQYKEWAEGLSEDDYGAMQNYWGMGYSDMHRMARGQPFTRDDNRDATTEEKQRYMDWALDPRGLAEKGPPPLPDARPGESNPEFTLGAWPRVRFQTPDTKRMEQVSEDIRKLDDVFARKGVSTPTRMEVTRSAYLPGISAEMLADSVGKVAIDPTFVSTFVGPAHGRPIGYISSAKAESIYRRHGGGKPGFKLSEIKEVGEGVLITLTIPKGTRVLPIEAARRYGGKYAEGGRYTERSESELLLPRNGKYTITGVKLNAGYSTGGPRGPDRDKSKDVPYHEVAITYAP